MFGCMDSSINYRSFDHLYNWLYLCEEMEQGEMLLLMDRIIRFLVQLKSIHLH